MSTYPTPELVSAVLADRRRTAEAGRLVRVARLARMCCAEASRGLIDRLTGRRPAAC